MSDIDEIIQELLLFRDNRDWAQFHNSKDLSLALSIEASELNELFLWKSSKDADLGKLKEELADVFAYAFLLANKHGFNVKEIILEKIRKNEESYPISKSRGKSNKYTEL